MLGNKSAEATPRARRSSARTSLAPAGDDADSNADGRRQTRSRAAAAAAPSAEPTPRGKRGRREAVPEEPESDAEPHSGGRKRQRRGTAPSSPGSPAEPEDIQSGPEELDEPDDVESYLNEEEKVFYRHVQDTAAKFPERRSHIQRISRFMGHKFETPSLPSLFVWGHASTGKTSVICHLFKPLIKRYAYVDCRMCVAPRILFETILDQLVGIGVQPGSQSDATGPPFARYAKCDNLAEFVVLLGEIYALEAGKEKESRYLIFDNAERLRDMGPTLIAALSRLPEIIDRNISVIFISKAPFDSYRSKNGVVEPLLLHFEAYSRKELFAILCRSEDLESDAERPLYRRFLDHIIEIFMPSSRDVTELQHVVSLLWPTYVEPVRSGELQATDTNLLFRRSMPKIRQVSDKLFLREISSTEWLAQSSAETAMLATVGPASEQQEAAHLPRLAKYLLIAAFLASYNPQKYDRRLFLKRDSSATTRRGGRKAGQIKETHGNERQQLLGPKVFALDRMIAIFHSILDEPVDVTVDFHTQIASLFALNMLQRTSEDGVEKLEGVRGKCNISYEFVQRLAKDLGFELGNYLYNFTE